MSDQEQQRPADDQAQQPATPQPEAQNEGGGDQGDKASESAGAVQVIHGANNQTFENLANSTVGDVRDTLAEVFNIPGDAQALVNGENIGNNYRLKANDTLEFIKQAGVKGN